MPHLVLLLCGIESGFDSFNSATWIKYNHTISIISFVSYPPQQCNYFVIAYTDTDTVQCARSLVGCVHYISECYSPNISYNRYIPRFPIRFPFQQGIFSWSASLYSWDLWCQSGFVNTTVGSTLVAKDWIRSSLFC